MKNKILFVLIIALTIAMLVVPSTAVLPPKSPIPSGNPFNTIWSLFQDLQGQITTLQTQVNNIPAGAQGPLELMEAQDRWS